MRGVQQLGGNVVLEGGARGVGALVGKCGECVDIGREGLHFAGVLK